MSDPLCKDCRHYYQDVLDWADVSFKCTRKAQTMSDRVHGMTFHNGTMLSCQSEREMSRTLLEYIFGENKDKCGKEGRYFESR